MSTVWSAKNLALSFRNKVKLNFKIFFYILHFELKKMSSG